MADEIKHALDLAKQALPYAGTALAALSPVGKKILGLAADEIEERWLDARRLYRFGRQLECVKKAEKMAEDAGFTPKAVPIKTLFPLLEGASLEEDEDLHTMWAALLANASGPEGEKVRPDFIDVMKRMSPDEAKLLKWLFDERMHDDKKPTNKLHTTDGLISVYANTLNLGDSEWEAKLCIQGLLANALIFPVPDSGRFLLTARGFTFVLCCTPPLEIAAEDV